MSNKLKVSKCKTACKTGKCGRKVFCKCNDRFPAPKSKERKIKAYTAKQISRAVKIAYKEASRDSWNVPYLYEDSARTEIMKALRKL